MPKKTNKTDHVLGLLSGKAGAEEDGTKKNAPGAAQADREDHKNNGHVQIVSPKAEEDEIADAVKELLEQELLAEEGAQAAEEAQTAAEPTEAAAGIEAQAAGDGIQEPTEAAGTEARAAKSGMQGPETAAAGAGAQADEAVMELDAGEPQAGAVMAEAVREPQTEDTAAGAVQEPEKAQERAMELEVAEAEEKMILEEAESEGEDASEFQFVNVMERLVRDKVSMYMDMFGTCKCSRCVADTIAVTLTHLTPKYVVVSKNAVAPLMNYYSQHYAGQITVEITKACTLVSERPHHGR